MERELRCATRSKSTAGFTLLEVLVALAMVSLVLVPLIRLHLLSLDATIRAQDLTTAVLLAQGQLASLGPFPEVGEDEGNYDAPELVKYTWQTVVTDHTFITPATGAPVEVRHIVLTIRWSDGPRQHHYALESYASR